MDPYVAIDGLSAQARLADLVVTSDNVDLTDIPKALYVGVGGDIAMIGVGASSLSLGVTWKNVPSGAILPFRPRRILATGTTATNILAIR
jgi:hypothetical protein